MSAITKAAIEAVGSEKPEDWQLKPETHAEKLQAKAGPLKRVLEQNAQSKIIDRYYRADRQAIAAQKRYKNLALNAAIASFLAVFIAGFLLLPLSTELSPRLLSWLSGIQFVLIIISFIFSLLISYFKPFEIWMRKRAEAENARHALFNQIMSAKEETQGDDELELLPLQLEYFRRFQLDVQRLYYSRRGAQHARAVRYMTVWRVVALILIILAVIPLVSSLQGYNWMPDLLRPLFDPVLTGTDVLQRNFLFFGLLGAALQGLLASVSLISQHERNAARYLDTFQNLEDLASRPLEEARVAAANGDRERVLAFVALVQDQISSEHREWIALRSIAPDLALDRLRDSSLPKLL